MRGGSQGAWSSRSSAIPSRMSCSLVRVSVMPETAATRSLLNTAKLMQENPLLVRLKELEALEKLVEKVGRIDLHATGQGGGLEALLQNLWRMGKEERAAQ